eukprot:6490210-Amphidinium_carterae.1
MGGRVRKSAAGGWISRTGRPLCSSATRSQGHPLLEPGLGNIKKPRRQFDVVILVVSQNPLAHRSNNLHCVRFVAEQGAVSSHSVALANVGIGNNFETRYVQTRQNPNEGIRLVLAQQLIARKCFPLECVDQ